MLDVYLIYRSITRAQAAEEVLARAGIACSVGRSPARLSPQGCAYALRLRRRDLSAASDRLRRAGRLPLSAWQRTAEDAFGRLEL